VKRKKKKKKREEGGRKQDILHANKPRGQSNWERTNKGSKGRRAATVQSFSCSSPLLSILGLLLRSSSMAKKLKTEETSSPSSSFSSSSSS